MMAAPLSCCLRGLCLCLLLLSARAPAVDLPVALSNNAVVSLLADADGNGNVGQVDVYSFTGLGSGKTWRDVSASGWWLPAGSRRWQRLPPVPDSASGADTTQRGRLAAVAVAAADAVWLFGGYHVAADGSEVSSPDVYQINARRKPVYRRSTPIPIPVDDTLALVYRDRYVYLISGWHDLGNVNLVQLFDTRTQSWTQATPYPGTPVFGHAGGMLGGHMLVCGGVALSHPASGKRSFGMSAECWRGSIDTDDHRRIDWHPAAAMPGLPRYRAAAAADVQRGLIVFAAGSAQAYNYNGIGYDGIPATPLDSVVSFNLARQQWQCHARLETASMDHRGLLLVADTGELIRIGGMHAGQKVSAAWLQQPLPPELPCQ